MSEVRLQSTIICISVKALNVQKNFFTSAKNNYSDLFLDGGFYPFLS